ncbi:hypothetical protein I302_100058 [Kwoniella bestiolae CBS 10118]|uniref:F-box domain-containing protein n=1 Tax=Kwoniella bestiolae CBS 10118 TaxID=1296100 RepID=A0AAJ8JZN8_9TREE
MPPHPTPARRRAITRLSINLGRLPLEVSHYIIEIIKARNDRPTILSLIRTCKKLYRICAPTLYEEIYLHEDNINDVLYGLQPAYDGSVIPTHCPDPMDDNDPFSRKYNLFRSVRFLIISDLMAFEALLKVTDDCWGPYDSKEPIMDFLGDLITLSIGPCVFLEMEMDDPWEWEHVLGRLGGLSPTIALCYDTGEETLSYSTSIILRDSLADTYTDTLSMHVLDLDGVNLDKYEIKNVQIFFIQTKEIEDRYLREMYPQYQEETIKSFMTRHFDPQAPSFVGLHSRIKTIQFHNVIYCDNKKKIKRQTKITDWITRTRITEHNQRTMVKAPHLLKERPDADESSRHGVHAGTSRPQVEKNHELRLSRLPTWIVDLFEQQEKLDRIADMVEFWHSGHGQCDGCGRR